MGASESELKTIRRNYVKDLVDRYVPMYFTISEEVINDIADDVEFYDYIKYEDRDCIIRSFMNTLFFHLQDHEIYKIKLKYINLGCDDFDDFPNALVMKIEEFAASYIYHKFFSITDEDLIEADEDDFVQKLKDKKIEF